MPPPAVQADEPAFDERISEPRIMLIRHFVPTPLHDGFVGYVGGVQDVGQRTITTYAFIHIKENEDSCWLPTASADGYNLHFPGLEYDDIVPMFAALYRVTGLNLGGKGASIDFKRLDAADIPRGVSVQRDTYVFVVKGFGRLHKRRLLIHEVEASKRNSAVPQLVVEIQPDPDDVISGSGIRPKTPPPQTVKTGDYLLIDVYYHKVRGVTLPDPKQHVMGWLELEATSLKELPTTASPSAKPGESKQCPK